ncbi:MAG: nicotinate-nucleotide diphosphorylase (carboxylating), partial [Methylophilaceae bacterium]
MQTLDPQSTSFQHQIQQQVAQALAEDIGVADFTAELSNPQKMGQATIVARESAVICGIPWVNQVFQQLSTDV